MGRNDCDPSTDHGTYTDLVKMVREGPGETILEKSNDNIIHSGHFMVSCLQDDVEDENEAVKEEPVGFNFDNAKKTTAKSYEFDENRQNASQVIDDSLTKLFQCMTLAYSGKLTSPKWKNFKGLKLTIKDKVRLNNIIWREWHMQYIKGITSKICLFEAPIGDKVHSKAEAVVLEGKYWKRRLASVTAEYQKWRRFHKKRVARGLSKEDQTLMQEVASHAGLLDNFGQSGSSVFRFGQTNYRSGRESPKLDQMIFDEEFMDFSDTLFSTFTGQLNVFPNPRELTQLNNADIIQPGLLQLQPTIEEEMDTQSLEPLPSLQEMMGGQVFLNSGKLSGLQNQSVSLMLDPSSPINDVLFNSGGFFGDSPQPTSSEYGDQLSGQIAADPSSQLSNQINTETKHVPLRNNIASYDNSYSSFSTASNNVVDSSVNLTNSKPNNTSILLSSASNNTGDSQLSQQQHQQNPTDPTVQLLNFLLANNAGVSPQLQQTVLGSVQQQQNQPQNLTQILQLLLQIQQQQSQQQQQQQQETQHLQQQIQQLFQAPEVQKSGLSQQLLQQQQGIYPSLLQQQQAIGNNKNLNVSPQGDLNTIGTSSSNSLQSQQIFHQLQPQQHNVDKQKEQNKVLSYPQLHNLLQGQQETAAASSLLPKTSSSPVVTFKQPAPSASTSKSDGHTRSKIKSQFNRQSSSHGLIGSSATSPQLSGGAGRRRSKSGDSAVKEEIRRRSTGSVHACQKSGGFLVPQNPVLPKILKQQVKIAPAPSATSQPSASSLGGKLSPATQNTFLAKLLTGESNVSTNFPLKEEKAKVHFANIRPKSAAPTTTTVTMSATSNKTFPLTTNSLNEYHKGLLVAANSQKFGVASTLKISDILSNSATIVQCNTSNPNSPQQFQVPSPAGSSESLSADRSRHPSNESIGSPPVPTAFTIGCIKEEQTTTSPIRSNPRRKTDLDPKAYQEHRRTSHINAEQKRRYNIKYGFDTLCQIVPTLTQNPNAKISKAAILQKSADYIVKLKSERSEMQSEAEVLKSEIDSLNQAIQNCQSQLPATGVPVSRQRANKMKERFDEYVRQRTLQNWKFWIFSIVIQPLFDTYNNMVSMATMEDLCRTTLSWLEQHCSLPTLRPGVSNSLLQLNTSTSILSDPSKVPEQAIKAVQMQSLQQQSSDDNSR